MGTLRHWDSPRAHVLAVEEPLKSLAATDRVAGSCQKGRAWGPALPAALACLSHAVRLPLQSGGVLVDKCGIRSKVLHCHFLTKSSLTFMGSEESFLSGRLQTRDSTD